MANLPVVIFQFALSPYKDWQHLAWAGALLITVTILILSIAARMVLAAMQSEPEKMMSTPAINLRLQTAAQTEPRDADGERRRSRSGTLISTTMRKRR